MQNWSYDSYNGGGITSYNELLHWTGHQWVIQPEQDKVCQSDRAALPKAIDLELCGGGDSTGGGTCDNTCPVVQEFALPPGSVRIYQVNATRLILTRFDADNQPTASVTLDGPVDSTLTGAKGACTATADQCIVIAMVDARAALFLVTLSSTGDFQHSDTQYGPAGGNGDTLAGQAAGSVFAAAGIRTGGGAAASQAYWQTWSVYGSVLQWQGCSDFGAQRPKATLSGPCPPRS